MEYNTVSFDFLIRIMCVLSQTNPDVEETSAKIKRDGVVS